MKEHLVLSIMWCTSLLRRLWKTGRRTPTGAAASMWRGTLNLPKTSLPLQAAAVEREPQIRQVANVSRLYQWQRYRQGGTTPLNGSNNNLFVLHDGPPYANGQVHMGHFVNRTLKDFVVRAALLHGHRVSFIPGWDCHGLPIELKALDVLKKKGQDPSRANVRAAARNVAMEASAAQAEAFASFFGVANWEDNNGRYMTLDSAFIAKQLDILACMVEKRLLRRTARPVMWSGKTMSSVAEAEVEYMDMKSCNVFVSFPLTLDSVSKACRTGPDRESVPARSAHEWVYRFPGVAALVWTTTPWTLYANRAVAVDGNCTYCVIQVESLSSSGHVLPDPAFYVVAENQIPYVRDVVLEGARVACVAKASGHDVCALNACAPFHLASDVLASEEKLVVPILPASHVDDLSGTGLVHTAPAHGPEDYALAQQHGLEAASPLGEDVRLNEHCLNHLDGFVPEMANERAYSDKVTDGVLRMLKQRSLLVRAIDGSHRYPMHWRLKEPIVYRSAPQWFVELGHRAATVSVQEEAANIVRKSVEFYPRGGSRGSSP